MSYRVGKRTRSIRATPKMPRVAKSYKRSRALAKFNAGSSGARTATKLAALRSIANSRTAGFLGIETKFYDTFVTPTAIAANATWVGCQKDPIGALACISAPSQGNAEQQRDGKKIVIKSVQISGIVQTLSLTGSAAPTLGHRVFVALVLDTQSNGAQCNSQDVFINQSADQNNATCPVRNLQYAKRFRVLKTWEVDLTATTLSHFAVASFTSLGTNQKFEFYAPMDLQVNFITGTAAGIAGVVDNSLHVMCITNNVGQVPTISYNARVRFQG